MLTGTGIGLERQTLKETMPKDVLISQAFQKISRSRKKCLLLQTKQLEVMVIEL